jgi:hypothetical protein
MDSEPEAATALLTSPLKVAIVAIFSCWWSRRQKKNPLEDITVKDHDSLYTNIID